jgi:hypothetical protein
MKVPAVLLCLVAGTLSLASSASAGARPTCPETLLQDWSDGRIDRAYAVDCYRAALRTLPEDLRAYSSAADDINRALRARITAARSVPNTKKRQLSNRSAVRVADPRSTAPSDNGVAAPTPLLALAAAALLFLAAGTSARLFRRRS